MKPPSRLRHTLTTILALLLVGAPSGFAASLAIESEVRDAYPGILAAWARGEAERAIQELVALETRVVRPNKADRDVEQLWRAKLGVIRETIERGSIGILVPIMLLHHDAYGQYANKRMSRLAKHSQTMSAELAEYYAANSKSPVAIRTAGDLLSSLGGQLQTGLVVRRSAELYERALALDVGNVAAHMGLGSIFERRNELIEAEEHYGMAVRFNPDSGEALIRHAICASRLGNLMVARRDLDRALALDGPDWVHRIAFQEKARLEGDLPAKESVAREGSERFPDSSHQAIQLAFLLEQQRQPGLALEIVNGLSSVAEEESERYRYARWPAAALAGARARLRQIAQDQNEILAGASDGAQIERPGE